jgi:nucleotide-binding universal stress UspA family protein
MNGEPLIRRILVPTDFSPAAELALRHAASLARVFGAELELLSSVFVSIFWGADTAVPVPADYYRAVRERAAADLEDRARALRANGLAVDCSVSSEHAASAACAIAASGRADLIALGTHGRTGLPHALLGSVAERVARLAVCPVLTLRADAGEPRPIRRILVATDFSADARSALDWAGALADRTGARIALVHALARAGDGAAEVEARLARLGDEFKGTVDERVVEPGHPDELVLRSARRLGSDLIAMGTRGTSGLEHVLLGSSAERVMRRSPLPVVVVKTP